MSYLREEIEEVKKEVKQIEEEEKSLAMQYVISLKEVNKRMFTLSTILIIALLVTNLAWLLVYNSYDYTSEYTDIDGGNGIASYIKESNTGDVIYGENKDN